MTNIANEHEPVCVEELGEAVLIPEFSPWVTSLCSRYHDSKRWGKYFLEKRGLSNDIQKELIPLARFCNQIASQRPMERLRYVHGSRQSFDAEIIKPNGQVSEVLEVTLACNGYQEALATEALSRYGYAPLYSTIEHAGSRANRVIPEPSLKSLDTEEVVEECIDLVHLAVAKKNNSGKYTDINLIVAFDDFRIIRPEERSRAAQAFVKITSQFKSIYFVGLCGLFFLQHRS